LSGGIVTITKADFSQLTILVIDDSEFVRRLVLEMLSGFGVGKILLAESADEAFARMDVARPDLIICDWQMHPVDGLAVLRKLRLQPSEDYPRIPFIMLTGHNSTDDVTTAIGEGADSYIVKPFSSATLMTHLLKVILADKGHLDNKESWAV
jgi:two-component system, chemotaxis family, chemotaxis protein CheY